MIVQTFIVILILSVGLICDVTGASYSNVYVKSEIVPMEYYSYGTPYPSIAKPRLSQINSLPSVPGYIAPCVSPCVYPAQTTVTPVNPSPNVLTYNAPSAPIVVAPTKQEATGYEYSYVVYDENTGDHKAQRELSDGSVVRGEYSFLQPDGYVRQVQYVADDISGFNAVVKQFLPAAVEGYRKVEGQENKESSPPCHEIKIESLKEGSEEDSEENSIKTEKSKGHQGTSKESEDSENSKEKHHKETKKVSKDEFGEETEEESRQNQLKKPKHSKEASGEKSEEKSKENPHMKPKYSKEESGQESEEKSKEKPLIKPKHSKAQSGEAFEEKSTDSEDSKEELKDKSRKKSTEGSEESKEKNKNKSMKGFKEGSDEDFGEESEEVGYGKHKEVHGLLKPQKEVHALLNPNEETLVPYNDILRCIEAAIRRNYGVPAAVRQEPSPLTYIVLNKPC